jgi:hypothetical protein
VVADRTSSVGPSTPSCFASKSVVPYSIDHFPPSAAFWNTWICHYDWQEQISAEAVDAEAPGALELDTMGLDRESDPMELDSMESGKDPDAMESNAG